MFIWSQDAEELLDWGQFSPLLPEHEPLQTSQLLTNLLMLDWNYMLEPQRLQSTATLVRPNTVIEKTWASAQPIKHRQLQATRSNRIVTGPRWSVLFWKWYNKMSPSLSQAIKPLRLNVRAPPSFFFFPSRFKILFADPFFDVACRQLGARWCIYAVLLILPFCRCIAIGMNAADRIRSKSVERWLLRTPHLSVTEDSEDDLCGVLSAG